MKIKENIINLNPASNESFIISSMIFINEGKKEGDLVLTISLLFISEIFSSLNSLVIFPLGCRINESFKMIGVRNEFSSTAIGFSIVLKM